MTAPLFTVLLPTHASPLTLPVAIRSILGQRETSFELLVVGDGASDDTARVVGSFDDPRIRWLDLPKAPGAGYANRNRALREAEGSLVAYAQDDDIWLPDHLSRLGQVLSNKPGITWAYATALWVARDGIVIPCLTNLKLRQHRHEFLHVRNTIPSNAVAHRRDCLDRVGYWRETAEPAADWELWKRIIAADGPGRLAYLRTPTVLHFQSVARGDDRPWVPDGRLRRLDLISRVSRSWPDHLRLDLSDGTAAPVQARVETLMGDDPLGVAKRLRAGTEDFRDLLAWSGLEDGLL